MEEKDDFVIIDEVKEGATVKDTELSLKDLTGKTTDEEPLRVDNSLPEFEKADI